MARSALFVVMVLSLTGGLRAQTRAPLEKALPQFEAALTRIVRETEPAVVRILVSRSEDYARLAPSPAPDYPGRLGGFDPIPLLRALPPTEEAKRIRLTRLDLSRPELTPETSGSGVVLDASGLILTNFHLVREATKVFVRLPSGEGSYADIYAADGRSDLAVLKLITPPQRIKPLPLGRAEEVMRGQLVLAMVNIPNPTFRGTFPNTSWGIISAINYPPRSQRKGEDDRTGLLHRYGTLLQVDVGINLGVSGGALINLNGELIGLTGPLGALTGLDVPGGFAIPMSEAMRAIINRLREGKEVEYGFLGITFDPQRGERNPMGGVRITGITPNTPAHEANLPHNGVLVRIGRTAIQDTDDLSLAISTALAGSRVTLGIRDPGGAAVREYTVILAKMPLQSRSIAAVRPPALGGLRVDYLTTVVRGPGDTRLGSRGVVVREVLPGSPADKARIQPDRVITRVNGREVATPADYYREAERAGATLELTFNTDEKVTLPLR